MEVIANVFKDNMTLVVPFKTTDNLVNVRQTIQKYLPIDLTKYVIMYKTNDENTKQILIEDILPQLLLNSKRLNLFLEELEPNETSQRDDSGVGIINLNVSVSLPVVRHTSTIKNANLDHKRKKWLKIEQHFDAKVISTKFYISEISSNDGITYLKSHLIKNDMPIPVQELITKNLHILAQDTSPISDSSLEINRNDFNNNQSVDIITKIKSKIFQNQLIVVIVYAVVDNKQKNFATSLIKKMLSHQKSNQDIEHMLDEWIDENIVSFN
ncbi:unnamed protein product [Rotaria sp. Silwood1]|nr:unnamed protein product [Rotaria sp. Silwood1]CAF4990686.1 unnamed protein product [Rotaria sp. Silwood1]